MSSFEYVTSSDAIVNLLCPICHQPFVEPWMSTTCEHFYCRACIQEHLKSSNTCPCDRSILDVNNNGIVSAPRLVKLLCDELVVQCLDCNKWSGQRGDWAKHSRDECEKLKGGCKHGCGQLVMANQSALERHEDVECRLRRVVCEMCKCSVKYEDLQEHSLDCPAVSMDCPYCQLSDLTRATLPAHLANDCLETLVACPHTRFGCEWLGKRGIIAAQHLTDDCPYEQLKAFLHLHETQIDNLQLENRNLTLNVSDSIVTIEALSRRVDQLECRVGHNSIPADSLTPPTSTILESLSSISSQIKNMTISLEQVKRASEQSVYELQGEISVLQMGLHDLRGEIIAFQQAQYHESASRYWARTQNVSTAPGSIDSSKGRAPASSPPNAETPLLGPYTSFSFSPYAAAGGQTMYPLLHMQSSRRFYGWPYQANSWGGPSSPDGGLSGQAGGTKL